MALLIGGMIGGNGGSYFSYYGGTDGRVVQKIKVWSGPSTIKAIAVWLSDGVQKTFGNPDENPSHLRAQEFSFNQGERVTSLSLWGNGAGTRSGWIRFYTNQERKFDFGMYKWGKKTEYPQDVASGILVGFTGRAAGDVDCLGVVFLYPITKCEISYAGYPTLHFSGTSGDGATSITPIPSTKSFNLRSTADVGDRSSTQELAWEVADELNFDVSQSWSLSNTDTGLLQFIDISSISVLMADTPALYFVGKDVGWKTGGAVEGSSLSFSSPLSIPLTRTGSLLPSESVALSALIYRGDVSNLPFDASAWVDTTNGSFDISIQGEFTGQTYGCQYSQPQESERPAKATRASTPGRRTK